MARKNRVWYPGAIYHITCRGNRKNTLFHDERDYKTYLYYLEKARRRYPFYLHAYCLMKNHVHLHLETIDDHIQYIMKKINSLYAIYFNKRYDLVGHVFQGRYKSEIIDSRSYFLKASRYIHLNPVKANIVKFPSDYKWSSCAAYEKDRADQHVNKERTLSLLHEPQKENYIKFLYEGASPPAL